MLSLVAALTLANAVAVPDLNSQLSSSGSRLELFYDSRGTLTLARGELGLLGDPVAFVRERAAPLGLRADEQLAAVADQTEPDGSRHVRLVRSVRGIQVEFDQLRVHARATGYATALEAEVSDLTGFSPPVPTVAPSRAIALASGQYQGRYLTAPRTELVIVGSRFNGLSEPHLAWKVLVAFPPADGQVPVIEHVYLDATTGLELGRLSRVYTAGGTPVTMTDTNLDSQRVTLNATQYTTGVALQDLVTLQASGGQSYVVDATNNYAIYNASSTSGTFGDRQAVSVADNVRRALKFDLETFGWNKWNFTNTPSTTGGTLIGVAHVGTKMANAYFTTISSNGETFGTMNYGDGDDNTIVEPARCLDVTGHEIGHGIVTGTADLTYHNQSGALNEHFADVFGWMLDSANDTMGELCVGPYFKGLPLRDMCHPGASGDPQPENMSQYKDLPDTKDGDNGGVHVNSGIPNHAACLFRNATNFTAVGKVWFRALSQHLGPTSSFADMVQATTTSCTELALGTTTCNALTEAWRQVGLAAGSSSGSCPANSTQQGTSCYCNAGYHVNAAGTGCDPDAAVTCPLHAHAVGTDCYCDTGYVLNATSDACVPSTSSEACGAHSHREGSSCVCDECYQFGSSPTGESRTCVATPNCVVCTDPLKTSSNGACVCEVGTQPSGNTCEGVLGNCGKENYAGRCAGTELIYCNDIDSQGNPLPANQVKIEAIDCSQNSTKTTCGLTDNGYDCVAPTSSCGNVPSTGACTNQGSAQICDQGTLKTIDCGANGCSTYTYKGTQFTFCNLCPPHATYNETDDSCYCNTGYTPTGTAGQQTCSPTGGTGGGSGSGGGSGGGGKTGCTTTGFELQLFTLLALFLLRRNR